MNRRKNKCLIVSSGCCFLAALAHLGCIVFGADWYRMFGAGEAMAKMAEQGLWYPTLVTLTIAAVLFVWGTFALAGSGVIRKLPFTRSILVVITSVFLLRASYFPALMPMFPDNSLTFWLVSSGICLFIGSLFAFGTKQEWSRLAQAST
jgi:cytochrome bd-type quinol oxidase subunit 2